MLVSSAHPSSAIYSAQGTSKLARLRCPLHSSIRPSPEIPTASPHCPLLQSWSPNLKPQPACCPVAQTPGCRTPQAKLLSPPELCTASTQGAEWGSMSGGPGPLFPHENKHQPRPKNQDLVLEKTSSQPHPAGNMPRRTQKAGGSEKKWCVITPEGPFQVRLESQAR